MLSWWLSEAKPDWQPVQVDVGGSGLASSLWEALQQGTMADFTLLCDGARLPCHRLLLATRSEFFRGLLTTELSEARTDVFTVTDVGVETLRLVLEFLYTDRLRDTADELGQEQVQLLMNAADFYVVPGLKRLCEDWLIFGLDTTNMVDRLILGDTYNAANLRRVAKEMLLENAKKLEQVPDWQAKLATRTQLVLEVFGDLAKSSM